MNNFLTAYEVDKSCKVNKTLAFLRRLPFIKKIIPPDIYGVSILKKILSFMFLYGEIVKSIFFKIIYVVCVAFWSYMMHGIVPEVDIDRALVGRGFLAAFMLVTIIGAVGNNDIFEKTDEDKYNTVFMLRMDAKSFLLQHYCFKHIMYFIGTFLVMIPTAIILKIPFYFILLVPLYAVALRVMILGIQLMAWKKNRRFGQQVYFGGVGYLLIVGAAAGALALGMNNITFSSLLCVPVMLVVIAVAAVLSLTVIKNYEDFKIGYKIAVSETKTRVVSTKTAHIAASSKALSYDGSSASRRSGLKGFHETFVKRHKSILWNRSLITAAIAGGAMIILLLVLLISNNFGEGAVGMPDKAVSKIILAMVFVCYVMNCGEGFTNALFINCDHSMLTYAFYKEPRKILKLFWLRLFELIKVNVFPAAILGVGLVLIALKFGGTSTLNYGALFFSPVLISTFFAVHYMTLYYLLQPFDSQSVNKSPAYQVIKVVTYLVSYQILQMDISGMIFVAIICIFCVVYSIAACVVVYKKAPKTFRIHK